MAIGYAAHRGQQGRTSKFGIADWTILDRELWQCVRSFQVELLDVTGLAGDHEFRAEQVEADNGRAFHAGLDALMRDLKGVGRAGAGIRD